MKKVDTTRQGRYFAAEEKESANTDMQSPTQTEIIDQTNPSKNQALLSRRFFTPVAVAVLSVVASLSANAANFKTIPSMTESSLEHAAKVQSTTHRLFAGQGYTYRVQCGWVKDVSKCAERSFQELAEYYSQPDHVQVSDVILKNGGNASQKTNEELDRVIKSLTHYKSGGMSGPLSQKEVHSIVTMQSAMHNILFQMKTGKNLEIRTGSEGNGFGGSTFVLVFDPANTELLIMGNGYAE